MKSQETTEIVTLFRTCNYRHRSYDKFKWSGSGKWTEAADWDPNPEIDCGNGLHAVGNGLWGDYLSSKKGDILQIIEVPKDCLVKSSDNDKWRFQKAFTKKEYKIKYNKRFLK